MNRNFSHVGGTTKAETTSLLAIKLTSQKHNMQILLLLSLAFLHWASAKVPSNAILLSNVKSLTLRGDQLTTARRVKAIPQLKCVGGSGKGLYDVDVMRCKNTGSEYDAEDISWTCQANLPPEFKLGSTEVICEGYASADDPYVLKGSCGVEYRLALTGLGESKYGNRKWRSSSKNSSSDNDSPSMIFTTFFWLIFLGIVGFFVYKIFIEGTGTNRRINDGFRRYYGGGGDGGDDGSDPPPPYTRRPPRPAAKKTQPTQQSWRPGFFSGAAAGAAAGYAMGNRGNTRNQYPPPQAGPSNWFSTGARNTTPNNSGWGSSQSSDPAPSSSRYESTGFGGTRRR